MARPLATLDAETDPFEHGEFPKPFIWGLYHADGYEEFTTVKEVAEFLFDKEWIVYAHNGGKFDFLFLAEFLNECENILMINGRVSKAKIGACEIRDSYCILPLPLRELNKDDFEYWKLKKEHRKKYMKEIKKYLYNDCLYLYEAIIAFRESYGDNITVASAAMKQWREISDTKPERTNKDYFNEINPFYHGGRVECFESGIVAGDVKVFDINSAYPFAMVHDHPAGKDYFYSKSLPKTEKEIKLSLIVLECESHGAFAIKTKAGTSFPNDGIRRVFNVTGWEYLAALEKCRLGRKPQIMWCYTFRHSINFTPYVEKFFALKDEAKKLGNKHQYVFAKLFLNSLYGKFGSNPQNYKEYQITPLQYMEAMESEGWSISNTAIKNKIVWEKPLEEEKYRFYNVATAASITGFVRAYLFKSLCESERPLYCDTDSIILIGNHKMTLHPTELGAWDMEAEGGRMAICGKKLYALEKNNGEYKIASKGAKLTAKDIFKIAEGEVINYKNEAPSMSLVSGEKFVTRNIRATVDLKKKVSKF